MAVKVIRTKPARSAVKEAVCLNCGATLEYVRNDVHEYHGHDYSGGPDGREWIVCPNCHKEVTLRSW